MICVLNNENIIVNIVNTDVPVNINERIWYPWNNLWDKYTDVEPLEYAKTRYISMAGKEFARRRDAIRWVDGYGYDCQSEDITNFMAAFTQLLVAKAGTVLYKVWLTETTKGVIERNYEQMLTVYNAVRSNQLDAYSWYEGIKAQLNAANTIEDLELIFPLGGNE